MKNVLKQNKAITLIALVITIIVLLILAGVTIASLTGENGLLERAKSAREETVVGQEKEQVELAYVSAAVKKLGDNVEKDDLQTELNASVGTLKTKVTGTSIFKVHFYDTNHNYSVETGIVTRVADGEIEEIPDDIFVALYNDGTLVFSNNEADITSNASSNNTTIKENYGNINNTIFNNENNTSWYMNGEITKANILNSIIPTNTQQWFARIT